MKNLILPLAFLLSFCIKAQTSLNIQDTIAATIHTNKIHTYTLNLAQNQFVLLKLNQIGIDLIATTFDVDGNKIMDFDSPNGKFGPEIILLSSTKKGNYRIEVRALDAKQNGNYKLYIQNVSSKANTLSGQVDQLFMPWNTLDSPGAAVAVIKDGEIIYQNQFGSANLEYNIPITTTSVFRTGSVAKQFTAFAIVLLEKQGKLSLDDDIRKYIPEVPDFGNTITLRHLANHTSGLREEGVLAALMGWQEGDLISTPQVLNIISKQKALNFRPGTQYMYCNTGYTLLAEIVARVSGLSFAAFTKEHIFKPLHMENTRFFDNPHSIVKNKVYSYYPKANSFSKAILNDFNPGSSGLLTTIADLSLWVMNFQKPIIGSRSLFADMEASGILENGTLTSYGLGLESRNYKGLQEIGHGGALGGFRARIARFPKENFAVIVLSNTSTIHPVHIPNSIIDIFLKDSFKSETENKPESNTSFTSQELEEYSINASLLKSYSGAYTSEELVTTYEITTKEGVLQLSHPRLDVQLIPIKKDTFIVAGWAYAEVVFTRDFESKINGFKFSMINVKNLVFSKKE